MVLMRNTSAGRLYAFRLLSGKRRLVTETEEQGKEAIPSHLQYEE
jgi:hypothetical protein